MANNRIPANDRLRSKIHSVVDELIINETIKTQTVASKITKNRYLDTSNHRIGHLISEVPFMVSEGHGVFRRVK